MECEKYEEHRKLQKVFDSNYYFRTEPQERNFLKRLKTSLNEFPPHVVLPYFRMFAESGSIPAMRYLSHYGLMNKDYTQAIEWAGYGAWYGDPASSLSLATFLMNRDQIPELTSLDPVDCEEATAQLLHYAALKHPLLGDKNVHFIVPHAQEYLETFKNNTPSRVSQMLDHYDTLIQNLSEESDATTAQITYILNKLQFFLDAQEYNALNSVVSLLDTKVFKSSKNAYFKNNPEACYQVANLLSKIKDKSLQAGGEWKTQKRKIRNNFLSLLQQAAKENVNAAWKLLLCKGCNEITIAELINAVEKTQKVDVPLASEINQVLDNLEKTKDKTIHHYLAQLFCQNRVKYVKKNEITAWHHAQRCTDPIEFLSTHAAYLNESTICAEATLYLIENKNTLNKENESLIKTYLDKVNPNTTQAVRKKIIELCLKDEALLEKAMDMIAAFCQEIKTADWAAESNFINSIITPLHKKAQELNNIKCARILALLFEQHSASISHPSITNNDEAHRYYLKVTGFGGDLDSLCKLIPCYQESNNWNQRTEAAHFWFELYKICAKDDKHAQLQEKARAMLNAMIQKWDRTIESPEDSLDNPDPSLYYYAFMANSQNFAKAWHQMRCAEQLVKENQKKSPGIQGKIYATGAVECLHKLAEEGKGWASWLKAWIRFNRLEALTQETCLPDTLIILEHIHNLLTNAADAKESFECADLTIADIDFHKGILYKHCSSLTRFEKDKCLGAAFDSFERAAQAGHSKAQVAWAECCLEPQKVKKGQESFEQAINYLLEASDKEKVATKYLKKIYENGYQFIPKGGGFITTEMLNKIEKQLKVVNIPPLKEEACPIEKAIYYLEIEKNYEKAYEILKEESKHSTVAKVYLGIMYRDGLYTQQSLPESIDLFTKALLQWKFDKSEVAAMNIAFEGIPPSPDWGCETALALLKHIVSCVLNNFSFSGSSGSMNTHISLALRLCELIAEKSNNQEDKNLLFNSGVAHLLGELYRKDTNLTILFNLVNCFSKRLLTMDLPPKEYEGDLYAPYHDLIDLLCQNILSKAQPLKFLTFPDPEQAEVIQELLGNLQGLIKKGNHEPFEYLYSLFHLCAAREKAEWADTKKGFEHLSRASINKNYTAMWLMGMLQRKAKKIKLGIPHAPNQGQKNIEEAAKNGDISALLTLCQSYIKSGKNSEVAMQYINKILRINSDNVFANKLLLDLICASKKDSLPLAQEKINSALEVLYKSQTFRASADLYHVYLDLLKEKPSLHPKEVIGLLIQSFLLCKQNYTERTFIELTKKNKLTALVTQWCYALEQNSPNDNQLLIDANMVTGWCYLLYIKQLALLNKKSPSEFECAKKYFEKSITQSQKKNINAYCLLARLYLESNAEDTDLGKVKENIVLAYKQLNQQKLSPNQFPLLTQLIRDYLSVMNALVEAIAPKTDKGLDADRVFITKLAAKLETDSKIVYL